MHHEGCCQRRQQPQELVRTCVSGTDQFDCSVLHILLVPRRGVFVDKATLLILVRLLHNALVGAGNVVVRQKSTQKRARGLEVHQESQAGSVSHRLVHERASSRTDLRRSGRDAVERRLHLRGKAQSRQHKGGHGRSHVQCKAQHDEDDEKRVVVGRVPVGDEVHRAEKREHEGHENEAPEVQEEAPLALQDLNAEDARGDARKAEDDRLVRRLDQGLVVTEDGLEDVRGEDDGAVVRHVVDEPGARRSDQAVTELGPLRVCAGPLPGRELLDALVRALLRVLELLRLLGPPLQQKHRRRRDGAEGVDEAELGARAERAPLVVERNQDEGNDVRRELTGHLPEERVAHTVGCLLAQHGVRVVRRLRLRLRRRRGRQRVDATDTDAHDQTAEADHGEHSVVRAPRHEARAQGTEHDERERDEHGLPPPQHVTQVAHRDHAQHRPEEDCTEQHALHPVRLVEVGRQRRGRVVQHPRRRVAVDLGVVVRHHDGHGDARGRKVVLHGEVADLADQRALARARTREPDDGAAVDGLVIELGHCVQAERRCFAMKYRYCSFY
eukprot:Rhum_TRINITY_DN2604_c0_g1::Rhum_TRINITY_DN2604_c0_g1_i1::g.7757::m.7757